MKERILLSFVVMIFGLTIAFSQTLSKEEKKSEKELEKAERKAKKEYRINSGKPMLFPIIAPGYTPELGGLIVTGGLLSFKTRPSDTLIQRSSFPVTVSYSTRGSMVINAFLKSFWFHDKMRICGDFWYKNMPDNYWGIGYDNGMNIPKSDSTTAYNRQWWRVNPRGFWQFKKYFFAGLNIDLNYTKGHNESTGVANDETYKKYNDKPFNSGLGLILRFDSRDIPVDTHKGLNVDLSATFYGPYLGSNNKFQIYMLDYKHFITIKRKGQVLGWYLKGRFTVGDVPYGEMSQLGTPFDLRGYLWGRFRDKNMIFLLAEYRHKFMSKDGNLSRHGPVVWTGTGTIFDTSSISDNTLHFLPNIGVGYRFEVQPRMNARLDFGIGKKSTGFYFNFNQAF